MNCSRLVNPIFRPLDANGKVVPYGYVYFYQAGTTNLQNAYADAAGVTPLANPARLSANGEIVAYLDDSLLYKINVETELHAQLPNWPQDSLKGMATLYTDFMNATDKEKGAGLMSWVSTLLYATGTIGKALKDAIQHFAGTSYPNSPLQGQIAYRTDKGRLDYFDGSWKSIWQEHGQCRFDYVSATICRLTPYNGNKLIIGSVIETIPSAGVDLAVAGLTPSTLYYVYAYMNGANMTLEASTTGHSKDATTGVEIKTGDSSRTLVGMVYPETGPAFTWTSAKRLVASWFSRRSTNVMGVYTATRTSSATTMTEIHSEVRVNFLTWASDSVVQCSYTGGCYNLTVNSVADSAIYVDGTWASIIGYVSGPASTMNPSCSGILGTSEGFHMATIYGRVGVGTGAWSGQLHVAASN